MDEKLLKVLEDCSSLELQKHFKGITLGELRDLPARLLKKKLTDLLCGVANSPPLVAELANRIVNADDDNIEEDMTDGRDTQEMPMRLQSKHEIKVVECTGPGFIDSENVGGELTETAGGNTLGPAEVDEDDDQLMIVGEVLGDVSFVPIPIVKTEILDLTTDQEEENHGIENMESKESNEEVSSANDPSCTSPLGNGNIGSTSFDASLVDPSGSASATETPPTAPPQGIMAEKKGPKIPFVPTPTNILKIRKNRRCYIYFSGVDMCRPTTLKPAAKRTKLSKNGSASSAGPLSFSLREWNALYKTCGVDRIKFLDCIHWNWNSLEDDDSPRNLFRLLSQHSENLQELSFYSHPTSASQFSHPLNLPNLKILTLYQDVAQGAGEGNNLNTYEVLNSGTLIRDIILGTKGGLEKISLCFRNRSTVTNFLKVLSSLDSDGLKSLKFLSLVNKDRKEALALLYSECELFSKLNCFNLEILFLDFCLWEDIKNPFEAILQRFSKLKKLVVTGCFTTNRKKDPTVILNFPVMNFLELLVLGPSDITATPSSFESISVRPPRRTRQSFVRVEPNNEGPNGTFPKDKEDGGDDEQGDFAHYFSVPCNLPFLPKLRVLYLGRLYEIQDLHFRAMPALITFRVSSPWHLSLKLPPEAARHKDKEYPLIKKLQLPDGIQDDGWVREVMPRFPNVEKIWINLPTVKVLRAFAFIMENSTSLSQLELAIQFDFESSLDAIFLGNPSSIFPSNEENVKLDVLKSYRYWKEYVKFHGIEVPVYGVEAKVLEDKEKYAGLCVLNEKFRKERSFFIRHVPRTLRVPSGELHWDDPNCKYSDNLLGFMNYPFPKALWTARPKGIRTTAFDWGAFPHRTVPSGRAPAFIIGLDSYTASPSCSKKERRED